MTLGTFVRKNRPRWQRLETMLAFIETRGPRKTTRPFLQELSALYRATTRPLAVGASLEHDGPGAATRCRGEVDLASCEANTEAESESNFSISLTRLIGFLCRQARKAQSWLRPGRA